MNLVEALRSGTRGLPISTISDYAAALAEWSPYGFGASSLGPTQQPFTQTLQGERAERIPNDFVGLARGAMKANGVVFACMLVRQLIFSGVRFQYQRFNDGRPSELFGNRDLLPLERPWFGGTTQGLLSRTIQDADLSGNAYWTEHDGELVRLRPDWVYIISVPRTVPGMVDEEGRRRPATLGYKRIGYVYQEGGFASEDNMVWLDVKKVVHWAPIPDPEAAFRGMSWLTPLIREVQADSLMTRHKIKFFENGATPNVIVRHGEKATPESVTRFAEMVAAKHAGVDNAYKTLHVGGGADVTIAGANLQQIEFKVTQGHGETRICMDAGVPPIIVGASEGLESATYSNYGQARRRLADGTMHPLWADVAGSFEPLVKDQGPGTRLHYDARDVPFLREDEKDAAEIQEIHARTIRTLTDGGYTPESAKAAVLSGDFGLLKHSGFYSVQLRPPGEMKPAAADQNGDQ